MLLCLNGEKGCARRPKGGIGYSNPCSGSIPSYFAFLVQMGSVPSGETVFGAKPGRRSTPSRPPMPSRRSRRRRSRIRRRRSRSRASEGTGQGVVPSLSASPMSQCRALRPAPLRNPEGQESPSSRCPSELGDCRRRASSASPRRFESRGSPSSSAFGTLPPRSANRKTEKQRSRSR